MPPSTPRLETADRDDRASLPLPRRDSGIVERGRTDATPGVHHVHRSERGELRLRLAAPSVLLLQYIGHADASFVDFIESVMATTIDRYRGAQLYLDCDKQTGYDAAFRDRFVAWMKQLEPETRCILVRSRMVAFAVAVDSQQIGGRRTTLTCRMAFEERLAASVRSSLVE